MIRAKAMPVVAVTAAMETRRRNAESEGAIAQQRQVEAVAVECHQDRARAPTIHRKTFDKAEHQLRLGLLADRTAANLGRGPRTTAIVSLGIEGGDGDDPVDRRL